MLIKAMSSVPFPTQVILMYNVPYKKAPKTE